MPNFPRFRVVKGKYDPKTKQWEKEYGAVWETKWTDGSKSLSMRLKEPLPADEWVKLVEVGGRKQMPDKKQAELPLGKEIDDNIPF